MSLSERAILTHLTISVWSGTVGREATETGLDPERDRIVHSVVPPAMLEGIKAYAGYYRRVHYKYSAPWDDNGLRLVPSQTLFQYTERMRECRDVFDGLAEKLIPNLQEAMEESYKDRFADLKPRFGSVLTFYPVPDGDKLPLIVDTVTESVRSSIVESMNSDAQVRTAEIKKKLILATLKRLLRLRSSSKTPGAPFPIADVDEALADTHLMIETLVALDPMLTNLRRAHDERHVSFLTSELEYLHVLK